MSTIRVVRRDIMQIGQNEEDTIDVFLQTFAFFHNKDVHEDVWSKPINQYDKWLDPFMQTILAIH